MCNVFDLRCLILVLAQVHVTKRQQNPPDIIIGITLPGPKQSVVRISLKPGILVRVSLKQCSMRVAVTTVTGFFTRKMFDPHFTRTGL